MSELLPITQTALDERDISYDVLECDPSLADTAQFCEHYGFGLDQSANAIIVASRSEDPQYCCCIVLAITRLDVNKAVRQLMGIKKLSFATADQTKEVTGMEIGGVTPFGLPKGLPIYVDAAVMDQTEVVVGGGNRSSKIILDPQQFKKVPGLQIIPDLAKPKEAI